MCRWLFRLVDVLMVVQTGSCSYGCSGWLMLLWLFRLVDVLMVVQTG